MEGASFVPSTVQEWHTFIQIIKQSSEPRQTILKFCELNILDHLLKAVKTERDDFLKINLLVLLQEYTTYFLEDDPKGRVEKVCSSLNSILSAPSDVNNAVMFQVKCQVLNTFTTMFIDQNVIKSQPKVFESFVEALLDMISKLNSGPDRLLRATACQCLQEFELSYPGVLGSNIGRLFHYSQHENSHVSQSYVSLFTTAFQHAVQLFEVETPQTVLSSSMTGVISTRHSLPRSFSASQLAISPLSLAAPDTPAAPFTIPLNMRYAPLAPSGNANIPEIVLKEVQRGISILAEQSVQLNEWGLSYLIEKFVPFVDLAHLPPTLLRHPSFYRLLFVNQPIFFHQLLYLAILFPQVYSADHSVIISRLIMMMRDILLPLEQRMLAINWLMALSRPEPSLPSPFSSPSTSSSSSLNSPSMVSPSASPPPPLSSSASVSPPPSRDNSNTTLPTFSPLPPLLFEHFRAFYPTVFDSLDLKEAKLNALLKCFANDPPGAAPPKNILEVLACVDDFKFYKAAERPAVVVFSLLFRLLVYFPSHLDPVYEFLLKTLRARPRFLVNLIRLIDALSAQAAISDSAQTQNAGAATHAGAAQTHAGLVLRMLQRFEAVLCSLQPRKLEPYLALAERIVVEPLIDPTGILLAIRNYLRVVPEGQWGYGQTILSIARWVLLKHQKMNVFKPLGELLNFMARFYPDIEIRDRAQFYLLMLTHLPAEKITLVLTQQNTPDEENVGFVSPYVPKAKTVRSIPKFMSLLRVSEAHPTTSVSMSEEFTPPESADPYEVYVAYINSPSLSISIDIPFELSYKLPPPSDVFPKKVYALQVQFSPNPSYEPLAPLRIPYLAMPEDSKTDATGFPYLYSLVLKFRPNIPLPASIIVKTLFNDMDGKTCKGDVDPVSINFQDLYMEVPIPPSITTPKEEFLRILFDNLWKATGDKSNSECIRSVKNIEVPHATITKALETNLNNFLIPEESIQEKTDDADKQADLETNNGGPIDLDKKILVCQKRVLLFLPTRFHVLLKFLIYEDHTLVKIRTDFWQILSYLDAFFNVTLSV